MEPQSDFIQASLPPLTKEQLLAEAVSIAETLRSSAIHSGQSLTWMRFGDPSEPDRLQPRPMNLSLYDGSAGVALFLGALAWATGETLYRDLALAAVIDLRVGPDTPTIQRAAGLQGRLGLGSAYGIGAVVYAFVRLSQFLEDIDLLRDAGRWAALITPELIASDCCSDVFSGSAGAILGLLALYDCSHDQRLLKQAQLCGGRVLDTRLASPTGYRAWVSIRDVFLTGFSHGAAGIAYALLRLYERAPDSEFLEAAREAIAYERSVFSPEAGNWPDFRRPSSQGPNFMVSWCHGAPGIALARLATLKLLDSEEIRQDIAVGLVTTRRSLLARNAVDHLCCGTLGRAETLFKAGQVLSYANMTDVALRASTFVVQMAKHQGAYHVDRSSHGVGHVGLFQGTSGIGYQLLRFADPESFPSVLLWE